MVELSPELVKGYSSQHVRRRKQLLFSLVDGEECSYCGEPMFKNARDNFDGAPLEADHENADVSRLAYRLIHRRCNRRIIGNWVEHGPGWYRKHGIDVDSLDLPGGEVVSWH